MVDTLNGESKKLSAKIVDAHIHLYSTSEQGQRGVRDPGVRREGRAPQPLRVQRPRVPLLSSPLVYVYLTQMFLLFFRFIEFRERFKLVSFI